MNYSRVIWIALVAITIVSATRSHVDAAPVELAPSVTIERVPLSECPAEDSCPPLERALRDCKNVSLKADPGAIGYQVYGEDCK